MKTRIKKAFQNFTEDCIVLVNSKKFFVIYNDILVEAYHGEYNSKCLIVYNTGNLEKMMENYLSKLFPELTIIVCK